MGRGRAKGRRQHLDKAFSRGGQVAVATGNYTGAVRAYALGDAINAATGGRMGSDDGIGIMRDMPRDPRDNVAFGPSQALSPAPIDPSRPDTKRPEPRLNEYPVAWNIPGQSNRLVPWSVLRQAADSVDIMRRCISVRQEQLQGLEWAIGLDERVVQHAYAAGDGSQGRRDIEAEMRRKFLPEIERLTKFWCYPWAQMGLSLEQWVNGLMEDHLVLDAVAIYPRVTYGGDVTGFELIDPTTIKLLIDYRGSRPQAPFPAYQQDLWGFPRGEFTATTTQHTDPDTGEVTTIVEPGMTADQLFYFRENFRSWTPYGYSAVEQALISARLYLKRQGWMLAEYDDGSTPLTWLVPDGKDGNLTEQLTYRTRRQWEDSINDELSGQTRARHRVKVGIPGMNPVQMTSVDERYKPEYDMHLIKMLAGHFGVTSSGLGFSEAKGLGNSGLHEGQANVQDAATTKPDTRMVERVINELSRVWLKMPPELCFRYVDPESEDAVAEDNTANAQRLRATITINEDRRRLGLAPLDIPEADALFLISGKDAVPVDGLLAKMEEVHAAEQQALAATTAASEAALEQPADNMAKAAELSALARFRRRRGAGGGRAFICKALEPDDFPGGVPADVDFAEWVWVADDEPDGVITKDYSAWWPRDAKGRWVKRGGPDFSAGPGNPGKAILAGLREQGEKDRAARAATVDVTAGSSAADKLRRAETMYGTDRSKWPAKARQDAAKLDRQVTSLGASSTVGDMTTPPKLSQTAQARLRRAARDGSVYADSDRAAKDIAALEAAGLLEPMPARADGRVYYRPTSTVDREAVAADRHPNTPAGVRAAYDELSAANGGNPVGLAELRGRLSGTREEQDRTLTALAFTQAATFWPEENQKTRTSADDAAALHVGGEDKHLIHFDRAAEQRATAAVDSVPGLRDRMAAVAQQRTTRVDDPEQLDGPVVVRQAADATGYAIPAPETEETATARVDALEERFNAAQRAAETYGDEIHMDDAYDDAAREAEYVRLQAEADRLRDELFAAERDLTDRFIAPRQTAEQERLARARGAAVEAANAKREADERQRQAEHQRKLAEEAMGRERREAERARIREQITAATPQVFARMLDGDAPLLTHAPSRKIVAQMREQGWKGVDQVGTLSEWEAPDGRRIGMSLGKGGKINFVERRDGKGHGALTQKEAAALVADKPAPAPDPDVQRVDAAEVGAAQPRNFAELTPDAYKRLLSAHADGRITHAQSRRIVETMQRQGWKLDDVKPGISEWKHEDGRRISMLSGKDKLTFIAGGKTLTGKAALEHVDSDQRATDAAIKRIRDAGGLDAQLDALNVELERPGIRAHTRERLEQVRTAHEQRVLAAHGPQETAEQRLERVKAEQAALREQRRAAEQRRIAGDVEYVGNVEPRNLNDGRALASRLDLRIFNHHDNPDGSFTFALATRQQDGTSARLATYDSKRGWVFPGTHLGLDQSDPTTVALWIQEGLNGDRFDDAHRRAFRVSERLKTADMVPRPKAEAPVQRRGATAVAAAPVRATRDDALAAAPRYVDADDSRKLDRAGTAAVEHYRGKAFTDINRELRAGTPSAATRRTVEQLDRVMADSRLTSDIEVHRGVGDIERMFGDAARRKLTGAEWTDNAPQSTTTDPDVAERFLVGGEGRRTAARIVMRVPAGVGAVQLSDGRYEAELLLQRGLRMRVVDDTGPWRRGQKAIRTITVEVVPA